MQNKFRNVVFKNLFKKSIKSFKKFLGRFIRKIKGHEIIITNNEIFFKDISKDNFVSDKPFFVRG